MRENGGDELREFFVFLKREYKGRVRTLPKGQVCIEADTFGLKNTEEKSIDRIMDAIKKSL